MGKKLKKNGFIEGSMIAYISIVITKILGMFYVIPFTAIIGDTGKFIYTCAYNIYNLVLNASTSGIPTAMSILVSEYNTRGMHRTKQKFYRTGVTVVFGISITLFLILQISAGAIGRFYMGQMTEGCTVGDIAAAVRTVSFCLLFAPFLSVRRGYLQGHNYIAPSSYSQVVEQVVRIAVLLLGSYAAIDLLGWGIGPGVNIALSGAAIGALVALIYLQITTYRHEKQMEAQMSNDRAPSTKAVIRRILKFSIPVVIVATSTNFYEIIDMKLLTEGLVRLNYGDIATQEISSITANFGPKICMIISALSMGLTASIVPNITGSFVKKRYGEVNRKFVLGVNTIIVIALPLAIGLSALSRPVYKMFYGDSEYGAIILSFLAFISVLSSIKIILCMALQSMGRAKLVCFCTILGIVVNAVLDLPMIFLFHYIGLPAYLGALFATAVGVTVCISIILYALKKSMRFRYTGIVRMLIKVLAPNLLMLSAVQLLKLILPFPNGRFMLFIYLCIYAAFGGAVYFGAAYMLGALDDVFGKGFVNKILIRLHIKKG